MEQSKVKKKEYGQLVKKMAPKSKFLRNCYRAYIVGGLICILGQFINDFFINRGFTKDEVSLITSIILVLLACILTGLGIYQKIGNFAGAGSSVPITGFANAISAPAIEYKKEGLIYGIGAKMFVIAGPVILYGLLTSSIVGLIYYLLKYVI